MCNEENGRLDELKTHFQVETVLSERLKSIRKVDDTFDQCPRCPPWNFPNSLRKCLKDGGVTFYVLLFMCLCFVFVR